MDIKAINIVFIEEVCGQEIYPNSLYANFADKAYVHIISHYVSLLVNLIHTQVHTLT